MSEKIEITLLGKVLRVAAPSIEEVSALQIAARALDQKMQQIRAQNQAMPHEKIALMAALNTMHELLCLQTQKQQAEQMVQSSVERMKQQLAESLA